MKDTVDQIYDELNAQVVRMLEHSLNQASRIAELETKLQEQDAMLGRRPCINNRCMDMVSAQSRIADLERQLAEASAPAVGQRPVARVTKGTQFGPGLAFLANGQVLPKPGTLLYTAPQAAGTDKVQTHKDVEWLIESAEIDKKNPALAAEIRAKCKAASAAVDTDKVREAENLRAGGLATVQAWKALQDAVKACRKVETGASIDNDKSPSDFKAGVVKGATDCIYAIGLIDAAKFGNETSFMAAQAPVREVPGWQPIETAPKDGSHILCCAPKLQFVGFYGDPINKWCYMAPGVPIAPTQPTHWMLLPTDPVQPEPKP